MKKDKYYLHPLIDAYKNSGWPSDERYFNIENGELIKNFSDIFLIHGKKQLIIGMM